MAVSDAEKAVIDKLDNADDKGCTFTGDEVVALRRVVKVVQAFDILGGLGHITWNVVRWFVVMATAYFAVKNGFIGWVKSL